MNWRHTVDTWRLLADDRNQFALAYLAILETLPDDEQKALAVVKLTRGLVTMLGDASTIFRATAEAIETELRSSQLDDAAGELEAASAGAVTRDAARQALQAALNAYADPEPGLDVTEVFRELGATVPKDRALGALRSAFAEERATIAQELDELVALVAAGGYVGDPDTVTRDRILKAATITAQNQGKSVGTILALWRSQLIEYEGLGPAPPPRPWETVT